MNGDQPMLGPYVPIAITGLKGATIWTALIDARNMVDDTVDIIPEAQFGMLQAGILIVAGLQLQIANNLLNKGYSLDTEIIPLIDKYGGLDNVPLADKDTQ